MKVVITGGSGFIGRALLARLHQDRRTSRTVIWSSTGRGRERIRAERPDADIIRTAPGSGDVAPEEIRDADVLFHLGWSSVPGTAEGSAADDVRENLIAGQRMLDQAAAMSVRRVVFVSSGGTVYGEPHYLPIDEGHPLAPTTVHGINKLAFERMLVRHAAHHGYEHLILRPSNVYGGTQRPERPQGVIGHWMSDLVEGKPLQLWNDPRTVRDYLHIDDMVDVLVRSMGALGPERIINVGTGVGTSLSHLIELIRSIRGGGINVVDRSAEPAPAVSVNVLDIGLLVREFGTTPAVELAEGLRRTWEGTRNEHLKG